MPRFETGRITLAYEDSGERDRPPILFLHGLSQAGSTWSRIAPAVAERYRVITLDQRGHGDSEHAPGTYDVTHYVADTAAFCERVVGEAAVLVGHSLGGVIATQLANERPDVVRALFLEDPPLFRGADGASREPSGVAKIFPVARQVLSEMRERNAPLAEYETLVRAAPSLARTGSMLDVLGDEGVAAIARSLSTLDPETFTPAIDGTTFGGVVPAPKLTCPIHVVRADPAFGPAFTEHDEERFLAANPHALVEVFEGASHAVHDEQPDQFQQALLAFLDRLG